jgi:uncharacterized membrane protein YphA (DoxX/SURF4 family)
MKAKSIAYWACTSLLALGIFAGGMGELTSQPETVAGTVFLGYPAYFVYILGVWKVLGALTIVLPGIPRIKEWAYAGMFINVTAAALSHAIMGDWGVTGFHIWVNMIFVGFIVGSWALRPAGRIVGDPRDGFGLRPSPASPAMALTR